MSANHRCDGKVALVTGCSRGLGKAIAARLAAQGATVALTARTMEPDPKYHGSLGQTLGEIVAAGGRAIAVQADLSRAEERERLFGEVVSAVGAPDILVNNAAVTFLRPLDEFPERRVRLMMEMHVLGPVHLSQLAIPAMRDRGRGWILNLTSVGGDLPPGPPFSEFDRTAGFGIYGTVKAARTRIAMLELGGLIVRDVDAMVLPDEALSENLLGLSFLSKLRRFEYANGQMVLEQ